MIEGKESFDRMLKSLMAVMMASQVIRAEIEIENTSYRENSSWNESLQQWRE